MSVHSEHLQDEPHDQSCDNDYDEPLGYQHFLYDVNIEYSPGGTRTHSECNKHSFKLKYLPYMIPHYHENHKNIKSLNSNNNNNNYKLRKYSVSSSNSSSINNCDPIHHSTSTPSSSSSPQHNRDQLDDISSLNSNKDKYNSSKSSSLLSEQAGVSYRYVDVTKETCGFLSNSDYVPSSISRQQRVQLELISAKLSQSTNLSYNTSHTSLVTLAEQQTLEQIEQAASSYNNLSTQNNESRSNNDTPNVVQFSSPNTSNTTISPPPSVSSKRFVNYTILIKTIPGLDKHPAVIERRFSDFLKLYQGLKSHESLANIIDKQITFPKKVYMGNFSLTNIAERSIEFSRLLSLCMTNVYLLWSVPFISFLLDKELKEAHRLSLFGDPDDVQALIETAYYIEKKLYLNYMIQSSTNTNSNSSISSESPVNNNDNYDTHNSSLQLPINGSRPNKISINSSNVDGVISTVDNYSNDHSNSSTSSNSSVSNSLKEVNAEPMANLPDKSNQSVVGDVSIEFDNSLLQIKRNLTPLNQRLLVTFCMLFITYYRGENYKELKLAVQGFSQMISSQEYVDSMLNTRHYMTLRACLLFLMNMNRGNIIDENQRLWLKRRLEDIDGAHADLDNSFDNANQSDLDSCSNNNINSPKNRKRSTNNSNNDSVVNNNNIATTMFRITKGDLTSLLRDRNFCSF